VTHITRPAGPTQSKGAHTDTRKQTAKTPPSPQQRRQGKTNNHTGKQGKNEARQTGRPQTKRAKKQTQKASQPPRKAKPTKRKRKAGKQTENPQETSRG